MIFLLFFYSTLLYNMARFIFLSMKKQTYRDPKRWVILTCVTAYPYEVMYKSMVLVYIFTCNLIAYKYMLELLYLIKSRFILFQKLAPRYLHIHASGDPSLRIDQCGVFRRAIKRRDPCVTSCGCYLQREDPWHDVLDHASLRRVMYFRISQWSHLCLVSFVLRRSSKWTPASSDITDRCQATHTRTFVDILGMFCFIFICN